MNPLRLLSLFVLALLPLCASSMDLAATRRAIDALVAQPRFAAARWGIAVVSLDSGRMLYAHDADRLFQPASTAKLYTAALVLNGLSAGYRIPTRVLGAAPDRRGRVNGAIVLYGMGDPSLGADPATAGWADTLALQLAARGVRRIRGDLVADDTYFAGPPLGDGWEANDLLSSYAAPASALSVHENRLRLTVTPAARAGQPAQLVLAPSALRLEGRLQTMAAGTPSDINLYRAPGSDLLHVFGTIAAQSPARDFRLAMDDPARSAGAELLQALRRHHIETSGRLRVRHWPRAEDASGTNLQVLAEVRSPPLETILRDGLKRSQNLYLQNLLQLAGLREQAAASTDAAGLTAFLSPADWGLRALRQLLDRIGIPPSASLIAEGTGLSRRDLTTPAALVRLLAFLANGPEAGTLRDMLPVAGVDGTLGTRMRGTRAAGNVHAKTGSMTYVNCLAGYVTSASGEHLAFAIMLNDYAPPPGMPASRDVDAIAVWLAELGEASTGPSP